MSQQCLSMLDAQAFAARIDSIYDSKINKLPRTFCETLNYHIDHLESHLTNWDLEGLTGITERTIKRYRSKKYTSRPDLKYVVLLCLALHLEPDYSEDLIRKAGHEMRDESKGDIACHVLLREYYKNDLDELDALLQIAGIDRKKKLRKQH